MDRPYSSGEDPVGGGCRGDCRGIAADIPLPGARPLEGGAQPHGGVGINIIIILY